MIFTYDPNNTDISKTSPKITERDYIIKEVYDIDEYLFQNLDKKHTKRWKLLELKALILMTKLTKVDEWV